MNFWSKVKIGYLGVLEDYAKIAGKYFNFGNNGALDATVTRANATATRINSLGNIEAVPANQARIDYTLGTDHCPNLLVERSRTNLFATPLVPANQTVTLVNGTTYTIRVQGSGSLGVTGATTATIVQGSPLTFVAGSTSLVCTITGTLTGVMVVVGQVALSVSNTVAPADVIQKTGLSAVIPQTAGTIMFDGYLQAGSLTDSVVRTGIGIATDANNRMAVDRTNNNMVFNVVNGGVSQAAISGAIINPLRNKRIKAIATYENNNFNLYINGALVGTDNSGTVPATSIMTLGGSVVANQEWDGLTRLLPVADLMTELEREQFFQYDSLEQMASEMQYVYEV